MSNQEERERLLQLEWREKVIPNLGGSQWIRVYQPGRTGLPEQVGFFCGLIPNANVQASLKTYKWDIYIGEGVPGFMQSYDETGNRQTLYDQYGHLKHKIEPLVIVRSFHGLRPDTIEIVEEFRFFHNLFLDDDNTTYVQHDESGDLVRVARVSDNTVDIRRKHIRQFLAAKRMSLVIYFERMCFSVLTLKQLSILEAAVDVKNGECAYQFSTINRDWWVHRDEKSQSWILGKKIIEGLPLEKCGLWPFDDENTRKYEEFIIGVDSDDELVLYTSDPEQLGNYFGKNPDAPQYVTPVYFKRGVLNRYYSEPSKYEVKDGYLSCQGLWGIRIDTSQPNYVIALLGDLGRDLPKKEQAHWKHNNVVPDGPLSRTAFKRWYLGEFAEPEDSAIVFQQTFMRFQDAWQNKQGWHLFLPLSEPDSHHFKTLRRPITQELSELDEIVLSLSKLLVDSINIKKLKYLILDFQTKDERGTDKRSIKILIEYLQMSGIDRAEDLSSCLRSVQELRSASAAHRKGGKYDKVAKRYGLDSAGTQWIADDIFSAITEFLINLGKHFLLDVSN